MTRISILSELLEVESITKEQCIQSILDDVAIGLERLLLRWDLC